MKQFGWGPAAPAIPLSACIFSVGMGLLCSGVLICCAFAPPPAETEKNLQIDKYLAHSKKIIALIDSFENIGHPLSDARNMPAFYRAAPVRALMADTYLLTLVIGAGNPHVRNDLFFGIYQDSCRVMDRFAARLEATRIMDAAKGAGGESFIVNIYRLNGFQSLCGPQNEAVDVLEIKHTDDRLRALGYSMVVVLPPS